MGQWQDREADLRWSALSVQLMQNIRILPAFFGHTCNFAAKHKMTLMLRHGPDNAADGEVPQCLLTSR